MSSLVPVFTRLALVAGRFLRIGRHYTSYSTMCGLNQMVNGLLALTKANMDASAVPMKLVQFDTLMEQVRLDLGRLQPDYTSSLTISPPDADPARWQRMGSELLLRTALFNLLENGVSFPPANAYRQPS